LIHVPLLIRGVDNFRGGRTVTEVVETRRLFPTVLDIAGVEGPDIDSVADQSLSSTIDGSSERREDAEAIAEYLVPQPDLKKLEQMVGQLDESVAQQCDRAIRAIRTARWKYIEYTDGTEELYDLDTDPHETSDVSSERSEVRRRLHQRLQDRCGPLRQGSQASETVDAGAQQRLEDLGYI
jgi:arylsulfatase A-like enzyme